MATDKTKSKFKFGSEPAGGDISEQERLLKLYWNRAELKKEFANLRDERHHLLDKIKQQEGATARALEKLESLENMLGNPDVAYNAIVFYQLRGLWKTCHIQLVQFGEELTKQQEDRERKKQMMRFNQDRQARLNKFDSEVNAIKAEADDLQNVMTSLFEKAEGLNGFWNFFKRRRVNSKAEDHKIRFDLIRSDLEELLEKRLKIESEPWPDFPGVSVEGRRIINVAVVALAQQLYIHFRDSDLGTMSRTSINKTVQDVRYGNRDDCDFIMRQVKTAIDRLKEDKSYATHLKLRTDYLRAKVQYRNKDETIPLAESVKEIALGLEGRPDGVIETAMPIPTNIMAEDFWNLYEALVN